MATIAFDVETNAEDPRTPFDNGFRVLGVSFCSDQGMEGYVPLGHNGCSPESHSLGMQRLRSLLGRADRLVFHNAKFDLMCFDRLGFPLWDWDWYDTMLMQHMIDENLPNKGLDYLGKLHFDDGKEKDEAFVNFLEVFGWSFMPQWMIEPYAIQDARITLKLFHYLMALMEEHGYLPKV